MVFAAQNSRLLYFSPQETKVTNDLKYFATLFIQEATEADND